jgi:hypothetical protein
MIVVLKPGESVSIQFAESDGELIVSFAEDRITVDAGEWYDTQGREGIVYEEIFGHGLDKLLAVENIPENPER